MVVVNDRGERTRNINQNKKSVVWQQPVDFHFMKNVAGESISSVTMWNIVNQLGEHDFSCGQAVNNLKDKELFSDQMNSNHFDPIFARRNWNCFTMKNLRYLNSDVNEI